MDKSADRTNGRSGPRLRWSTLLWSVGGLGLALLGFAAGRWSAPAAVAARSAPAPAPVVSRGDAPSAAFLVQTAPDNDPRELLPLPGNPGQGPGGQPVPGDGECPVYLYQDGQLFEFAPGQPGFPGGGDGSPELFPLQPAPRPGTPRQPPLFDSDDVVERPSALAVALKR